MARYPYRDLGITLDRDFRNNLNANFDDIEADLRDIQSNLDAKESRLAQIENDSIERDNDLDARIDNIVADAGNSNTEIVDARYDSINNVTHPTLKDRLDDTSNKIGILNDKLKYTANADNPLGIITPYGDNQLTHPKVLYFPNGWNGYKYWMAYTPLPYYDESKENPCIAVSNDMINWTVPEGLVNPLDVPAVYYDYLSDPHLVYIPETDTLECWYRAVDETNLAEVIYRRTTTDGVNWTPKEIMYSRASGNILQLLSPAIIWDSARKLYKIWVVDNYRIKYYETPDGKNWQYIKTLTVYYGESTATWHIDVEETDLGYEMLIATKGSNGARDSLFHAVFTENQTWADATKIIQPGEVGSWDDDAIYRSCFLKINGIYYVWYAGVSKQRMYGVSLSISSKPNDITSLRGINYSFDSKRTNELIFTPSDKTVTKLRGNAGRVEMFTGGAWQKIALQSDLELGYGIRHKISTGEITRVGSAIGKVPSDFDKIMPWAGMRRCNVPDDFLINAGSRTIYKVNAYFGDPNYKTDGSNGQVMVEVPAFYYKRIFVDSDTIETYISPLPLPGYNLHPWFYDANGNPVKKKYIGAYEASIYDVSAGAYLLNDEQVADFTAVTGDKLCSISGAKPASGLTQQLTLPNSRILATNRGTGWQLQYFNAVSAIQMLAMVEYATLHLQSAIGGGIAYITDDGTSNLAIKTGATDSLGNKSGRVSITHPVTGQTDYAISYRGIENFWGNIWKWIDGINIKDGKAYVSIVNGNFQSDVFSGQYMYVGFTLPTANGYISKMGLNYNFDFGFLPIETTGTASTHFADYFFQFNIDSGQYVAKMGGSWEDGSIAGPFALSVADGTASKSRKFGARLAI